MKFCWIMLTLFYAALPVAVLAGPFQAGTAAVDITPPVGYRMSGYFYERLSTGIKDPLLAKAIVFSQDDTLAALVVCDVVAIAPHVAGESRRLVERKLGIPAENVSVAATHSHTGPLYWGALRDYFHNATVKEMGSDPHEEVDYPSFLTKQIVAAVKQAKKNLRPVQAFAGNGSEKRVAFNRRFLKKDGLAATWIGINHPDVVGVAGPIDPQVGLIRFDSPDDDKPLSAIVSYALHLDTTGGDLYSADFPFYLQRELSGAYGKDFLSLFGIGACGDINHVDTAAKKRNGAEKIGTLLSESVLESMPTLEPITKPSLAVMNRVIEVPKQRYSAEEIARAKIDMKHLADGAVPFPKRVEAYKITALQDREGDTIPLEIHAFRLGPEVAILTLPGEVFVELGLRIKTKSPFATTVLIELANDAPGYIPTEKAFVEGGYETINSRVAPGGGEQMAQAAIRVLNEIYTSQE